MVTIDAGAVRGRRRVLTVVVVVTSVLLIAPGCGWRQREAPDDGLGVDTARFTYGGRSVEVPLTACGREDDVVVLAGREGEVVVQAWADLGDGGLERTGVTADLGVDGILGAFGAAMERGPAGEIADVRVEGDRLIVEGTWVGFDAELEPETTATSPGAGDGTGTGTSGVIGELRARCPETDDDTATGTVPSRT